MTEANRSRTSKIDPHATNNAERRFCREERVGHGEGGCHSAPGDMETPSGRKQSGSDQKLGHQRSVGRIVDTKEW